MNKPARQISRKKASQPGITARRPTTDKQTRVAPDKSGSAPRFSRITSSLDLIAPRDCEASVVLKQVAHDAYRCYAWWLLVGRYDQDAMSVRYRFNGEDAVRCDIPSGAELSAAALLPHLVKFLNSEHTQNDGPPIIIGKGKTS